MPKINSTPTESQEQAALVTWFRLHHHALGVPSHFLLISSQAGAPLGGGQGHARFARFAKLAAEGFVPGVPDLFLAVPRAPYNGLWIEMKRTKGGKVSPQQEKLHSLLAAQGYAVAVCLGADWAQQVIEAYLSGNPALAGALVGANVPC